MHDPSHGRPGERRDPDSLDLRLSTEGNAFAKMHTPGVLGPGPLAATTSGASLGVLGTHRRVTGLRRRSRSSGWTPIAYFENIGKRRRTSR
jgi:hypothetical protein